MFSESNLSLQSSWFGKQLIWEVCFSANDHKPIVNNAHCNKFLSIVRISHLSTLKVTRIVWFPVEDGKHTIIGHYWYCCLHSSHMGSVNWVLIFHSYFLFLVFRFLVPNGKWQGECVLMCKMKQNHLISSHVWTLILVVQDEGFTSIDIGSEILVPIAAINRPVTARIDVNDRKYTHIQMYARGGKQHDILIKCS